MRTVPILSAVVFADALEMNSKKYDLKNIEGFIVNKTRIVYQPKTLVRLLKKVTNGAVTQIIVHNHNNADLLEVTAT
jgi:hypothetical protein